VPKRVCFFYPLFMCCILGKTINLPPEDLTGEQSRPPPDVVRERQRSGNHQVMNLKSPIVAIPSSLAAMAGRRRSKQPSAVVAPGQGLIEGMAGRNPPHHCPVDSNGGDQPPPSDLAERHRRKPSGRTPPTGTRPNPTSTMYKDSGATPPPPSTGLASEFGVGLARRSRELPQLL
jgi:hypothetical protein